MNDTERINNLELVMRQYQIEQTRLAEKVRTLEQQLVANQNKQRQNHTRAKELLNKK